MSFAAYNLHENDNLKKERYKDLVCTKEGNK